MHAPRTFGPGPLRGAIAVPGDKSISHRALIAGASGRSPLRISGLNSGRDVRATLEALLALGARIEVADSGVVVTGAPLREPVAPIDCANSGSTARMLLGACAGAGIPVRMDGDASLRGRPMEPVAAELRAFGARIETAEGRLPLSLHRRDAIETRDFILIAPSAQVKSALLFAALFAGAPISISGDRGSRDHTERLLRYLGCRVEWDGRTIAFAPVPLPAAHLSIPGDFSAAAFFITAATIAAGSTIALRDVGVNPTRTGLLSALERMGAAIAMGPVRERCGEPVADLTVASAPLRPMHLDATQAARAIDEIPLLAVAAAFAPGETRIAGVADLHVKESDRIGAIRELLDAAGIETAYAGATLTVRGGTPRPPERVVETHGDHRIAMAAAVLACGAGPVGVDDAQSADVSFPGFSNVLASAQAAAAGVSR